MDSGENFVHALAAAFSVIIVSEVGDKTFFIAAILAMRHSRLEVLLGAMAANFIMIIISAAIGYATTIIPRALTYYTSSILFATFGLKMIKEAWSMSPDESQEEYEEAEDEIKKEEDKHVKASTLPKGTKSDTSGLQWSKIVSPVFLESFTLTFLGEWGDRSLFATIALGAREDVLGVVIGGLMGHTLCTGLAVVSGHLIAQRISLRTVTGVGGVMFLMFASTAVLYGPD